MVVPSISVQSRRQDLSAQEREKLLRPYLPKPHSNATTASSRSKQKPIRSFLGSKLHLLVYLGVHLIFGIYIRLRQTYSAITDRVLALVYYHHRTPELIERDVRNLSSLPEHLSVILTLKAPEDGGLDTLIDEVAELSSWCASAGIPVLSVYEKTGVLKPNLSSFHSLVSQRLRSYFGSSLQTPHLRLHAPHYPSHPAPPNELSESSIPTTNGATQRINPHAARTLDILLLSSVDGRGTLVDLTRTLAEKAQSQKLNPDDITQDLITDVISATTSIPFSAPSPPQPASPSLPSPVSIQSSPTHTNAIDPPSDPDLLIIFGPYVKLDGYPPWQLRLTEIFCVGDSSGSGSSNSNSSSNSSGYGSRNSRIGGGSRDRKRMSLGEDDDHNYDEDDQDGGDGIGTPVEYQGFLRALWRYDKAEIRFGR